MYTEDDEKVNVDNEDSNNNNDFYTSFNQLEKPEEKKKKEKKEKPKEIEEVKEEADYSNFYGTGDDEIVEEPNSGNNTDKKIKTIVIIVLASILLIAAIILIIKLISDNTVKGDIEINNPNISLKTGESDFISYTIVETENEVTSKFVSSDENVVIVDENGKITAVGSGTATITVYYTIDGKTREKTCSVEVSGESTIDQKITLNLNFSNGSNNNWTNKDVSITVNASSVFEIDNVKYAINCDGTCNYVDINNNSSIKISNEGTTTVTVVAHDKKNQTETKKVTVKIDKTAPKIEFNGNRNISGTKEVEVCATCTDSLSGCKQSKVCKKYNSSKTNQTITVYDNAGNKTNSISFNVSLNTVQQPCTLKVSSDGTVTATLNEAVVYYGFNSSFSGSNELSKKVTINATKAGESKAQLVTYYVKNKNGTSGKCYLTVIKECTCKDKGVANANCKNVTCTFRST